MKSYILYDLYIHADDLEYLQVDNYCSNSYYFSFFSLRTMRSGSYKIKTWSKFIQIWSVRITLCDARVIRDKNALSTAQTANEYICLSILLHQGMPVWIAIAIYCTYESFPAKHTVLSGVSKPNLLLYAQQLPVNFSKNMLFTCH